MIKNRTPYFSSFKILKCGKISLILSTLLGSITQSFASPSGENIISGSVDIDRSVINTTNINQSTSSSIIQWNSFNVNTNEVVNFNMPNSSSTSLNRVIGSESSKIYGQINSNGQVFLVNQNGIYFSKTSSVNTAGFTASTLDINNNNFKNKNYIFEGTSDSSIINFGTINTDNAYTALLSKTLVNEGVIQAKLGNVQLASGNKITLDINGNSLVKLTINEGTLDALVSNKGLVRADGGTVYLTTQALDEVLNGLVNNTGVIEANSIEEKDGTIILFAHGGTVGIGGELEAIDGFIETSGKEFSIEKGTIVSTGSWLIDPVNVTINSALASTLEGQLASGDATVTTASAGVDAGDITVNEDISWSSTSKLTLDAHNNIYVNATIENTNSTTGGVFFNASNTYDAVYFDTNGKVIVNNVFQLQWINTALKGKYELGSNIDASVTKTDTGTWGTDGFDPLGDNTTKFNGTFDGKNYSVSNLFINRASEDYVALFGFTYGNSIISNIGLIDIEVTGKNQVGALVGRSTGTIYNSYSSSIVVGNKQVGGLVGYTSGDISTSYSTSKVDGTNLVGGLVGKQEGGSSVYSSYSTGKVTGTGDYIGGLIGSSLGNVSNSYSTGDVFGNSHVGGLTGNNKNWISNSYSTGSVEGQRFVGGLSGSNISGGIKNSYSTGSVITNNKFGGGLVGSNNADIINSYSTGFVSATGSNLGGLVGNNTGSVLGSFWNTETSGFSTSVGGIRKTTLELNDINTYLNAGWDIKYLSGASSQSFSYAALTMGGASIWNIFLLKENKNLYQRYIDDATSRQSNHKENTFEISKNFNKEINNLNTLIPISADDELIFTSLLKEKKELK